MPFPVESSMGKLLAMSPSLDADGCIPNIAFKVPISSKAAAYTVLPSESGTYFINTAAVAYTLPSAALSAGCEYYFAPVADFSCTVNAVAGEMATFNDTTANSIALDQTGMQLGGIIHVCCTGTKWIAEAEVGNILQVLTITT
jgi:hypothetical protein